MSDDLVLFLLGAWVHQLLRVTVLLVEKPRALTTLSRKNRLDIALPGRVVSWPENLADGDKEQLQRFERAFRWEFYVFLILPMLFLFLWIFA